MENKFKNKDFNKGYKLGISISLVIISLSLIGFCLIIFSFNSLKFKLIGNYMEEVSSTYEGDSITIHLSYVCDSFIKEEDKIKCLNDFVFEFFNYNDKRETTFKHPDKLINNGGVCRDYAVFYSSVLSLMGFKWEYVFEPEHVYLKVHGENDYILDQWSMEVVSDE